MVALAVLLVIVGVLIYMLPTIVAGHRQVVNVGSVAVINILLGWSLIGWAVAMAMACRTNPNQYGGYGPTNPYQMPRSEYRPYDQELDQ